MIEIIIPLIFFLIMLSVANFSFNQLKGGKKMGVVVKFVGVLLFLWGLSVVINTFREKWINQKQRG